MLPFAAFLAALSVAQTSPSASPDGAPTCVAATGFTGTVCTPATAGKHPAVLLLGGSEGGNAMAPEAALFAKQGYVAASVAYFGIGDLPKSLQLIPVETIGKALAVVEKRDDVDASRIAILGISKGGELALLTASTYPEIRAVVADVPSPYAWEGIPAGADGARLSSWTAGGMPLPYVPYSAALGTAFEKAYAMHAPLDLRPAYDASTTENAASIPAAMFSLEKIRGPVLFLSGGDDRIWNSPEQSQTGIAYLQAHHHAYADESHEYPAAGHLFLLASPGRPLVDAPFAGGLTLLLGGTPDANVAAGSDAMARVAAFLTKALR